METIILYQETSNFQQKISNLNVVIFSYLYNSPIILLLQDNYPHSSQCLDACSPSSQEFH